MFKHMIYRDNVSDRKKGSHGELDACSVLETKQGLFISCVDQPPQFWRGAMSRWRDKNGEITYEHSPTSRDKGLTNTSSNSRK